MKRALAIITAACISWSGHASAQNQSTDWRWVTTFSTGSSWALAQGNSNVELSGGNIRAQLRAQESDKLIQLEISGTLKEKTKDRAGLPLTGNIVATVRTFGTDMNPSARYQGSYRKIIFSEKTRRDMGARYREVIILTDGFNVIGLTREVK